ncbi:hypothetical protein SSS_07337 [Sarcoptes scabiei]|uniref:Uncharacterized protein n=1 Tax=Sarcoptes scabiei TaxID=52283 RepID=A0A132A722_SARSC|nr:hypothetical protein SSS_07337 [Sarcoptes scabiei]KPM06776.1 hypothetical protein QR98_0052550 [Sarcoptes scabiei]
MKKFNKKDDLHKSVLEQQRKILHKEIERRRRDRINDWIYALSREVPDCASDRTKKGQSKGSILAKTVKFIQDQRAENQNLKRDYENISSEIKELKKRLIKLEDENEQLKNLISLSTNKLMKKEHSKKQS